MRGRLPKNSWGDKGNGITKTVFENHKSKRLIDLRTVP